MMNTIIVILPAIHLLLVFIFVDGVDISDLIAKDFQIQILPAFIND